MFSTRIFHFEIVRSIISINCRVVLYETQRYLLFMFISYLNLVNIENSTREMNQNHLRSVIITYIYFSTVKWTCTVKNLLTLKNFFASFLIALYNLWIRFYSQYSKINSTKHFHEFRKKVVVTNIYFSLVSNFVFMLRSTANQHIF